MSRDPDRPTSSKRITIFKKIDRNVRDTIFGKRKTALVTARSSGVRPGLSKGRYGHVSTHLDNPTCPVTGPERQAHNLL
ncbi:hypothetical protein YC2023_031781 [Brassica napus]